MDRNTGDNWLIHDTNHHKENQLQNLKPLYNTLSGNFNQIQESSRVMGSIRYS